MPSPPIDADPRSREAEHRRRWKEFNARELAALVGPPWAWRQPSISGKPTAHRVTRRGKLIRHDHTTNLRMLDRATWRTQRRDALRRAGLL